MPSLWDVIYLLLARAFRDVLQSCEGSEMLQADARGGFRCGRDVIEAIGLCLGRIKLWDFSLDVFLCAFMSIYFHYCRQYQQRLIMRRDT